MDVLTMMLILSVFAYGGVVKWDWDFGDGVSSNEINPTHVYSDTGTYTITLTVTDGDDLSDTWTEQYTVRPPRAAFVLAPTSGCVPHTVFFTDQSTLPDTWLWDFGDGKTSTVQNPVHTYMSSGVFTVTLTVKDTVFGCLDVFTQQVTVNLLTTDFIVSPDFGCAPLTTNFSDESIVSGSANISSWYWDFGDGNSSSDPDPIHTYENPGLYTVSLTTTLSNGCTDTETKMAAVQATGPQVNFGGDVLSGCPTLTVNFTDSTISGSIIDSWSWDFGDGNTSTDQNPTHTYNTFDTMDVSLTVTDLNMCSRTLTFNNFINTMDDEFPTISCPDNQTGNFGTSCNFTLLDYTSLATASDNCGTPVITQSPVAGTLVTENTAITLTATDDYGNQQTCTFDVILSDVSGPTAICQSTTVYLDESGNASIVASDIDGGSTDNCADFTLSAGQTAFTCADLGTNNVMLTVSDGVNSDNCIATVIVIDTTPPFITCPGNQIENFDRSCQFTLPNYTILGSASDNCGSPIIIQSPPAGTVIHANSSVTLTADDGNGNLRSCIFQVIPNDATPPISLCQNINIYIDGDGNASIVAADVDGGSTDNCSGLILSASQTVFTCADLGTNNVTLTVSDGINSDNCIAIVTVIDTTSPFITCPANQIENFDINCQFTLPDYTSLGSASDNCGSPIIIQSPPAGTAIYENTSVALTAEDGNGNLKTCTFDVILNDVTPPTSVCQNISVYLDGTGNASIVATDIDGGSIDNCESLSLSISSSSFTCADIGSIDIVLTAIDPSGNSSNCSTFVLVEDTISPITISKDITVFLGINGTASITTDMVDNGSSDACGIASLTLDKLAFSCNDIGSNLVVLTATDIHGNSSSSQATVTIKDIQITSISTILGMSPVCPSLKGVPYSIQSDPNVTSYIWTYSGGGATIHGNGSNSITIDFSPGATAGNLTVEYFTVCNPSGITGVLPIAIASQFTCSLANDCLLDNLFVLNSMINFTGGINLFKAGLSVNSAAKIDQGNVVIFRSGQDINLLPFFEVEKGALFIAEQEGCFDDLKAEEILEKR